ncbi:hypothetical protein F4820DRAFT_460375 [Hypoxylon rubiginosum]|uniref:Uncharacterized protein n=1 Tax=Hypoxylon rubiginosum TaxID=110542 RepID=A0ACB9YSM5_9PEZI|nr:hypothetical protein F4820DRAFT_460375 [Hypoxylon rubiginosum]
MADQRVSTPTGSRSTVRRTLRSSSQSPSRLQHRLGDDFLSQLSPNAAVEALRSPTGSLKICMDQASASEQAFAMRAAIASKKIRDWLEELYGWLWPRNSGSAGFEMPPTKRRKLSQSEPQGADTKGKLAESDPTHDGEYLGSLPAAVVDHYEKRVEQIQQDLDELDLEEIKSQVLHNHIFPLSRPGSPFSESGRSVASTSMFAKMEDLTAVVTAITVQALPNISRLSKLLDTWSVRLLILRKVPSLFQMITDAEIALRSGWSAIEEEKPSGLSRKDFDVMKRVIQQKVTKPGRALDYMLDLLEGSQDILPDDWLNDMEALERDYALWETTAEHKVRTGESSSLFEVSPKHVYRTEPETPQPKIQIHGPSPTKDSPESPDMMQFASPLKPSDYSPESGADGVLDTPSRGPLKGDFGAIPQRAAVKILVDKPDREIPGSTQRTTTSGQTSPVLGEVDQNIIRNTYQESKRPDVVVRSESTLADEPEAPVLEPSILEPVDEEGEEPDLPPARFLKRVESKDSFASTVIHEPPSSFVDHSDNVSFREGSMEPELPRLPDPDEPFSSDAISPPSSPPLRYKIRSTSVTFKDVPEITMLPEMNSTPPRSPLDPPETFDADTSFEYESQIGSPSRMSTISSNSEDEQLQQQITEILETIPAKFRFERKPRINLNPPDLNLPPRPKSKADNTRRSNSSLSSRAGTPYSRSGTPSFMLAPARENRPRTKSSQGIRVYNLTRSTGEPPLKLLIRSVGEKGERVMVRIGGGWADLGEYLREYALHHSSRSKGEGMVDVKDVPAVPSGLASSPSSRPNSAMGSPITPLAVRKTRKSLGEEGAPRYPPKTPFSSAKQESNTPNSEMSARSRESSHVDWDEEDSALGLAGPKGKKVDMNDESRKWVESVKEKVRIASGERPPPDQRLDTKFGEMGKVGGTKRLFRKH